MMDFWNFKAEKSENRSYYFRKSSFEYKLKKWWFQKWPNTAKFFDWRFQPFGAEASTWENWPVWSLPNSRLDKIFVFIILVFWNFGQNFVKMVISHFVTAKWHPFNLSWVHYRLRPHILQKMQKISSKFNKILRNSDLILA